MFSDEAGGGLLRALFSDGAGRGALCSPTPPWATGGERVATLSRSSGAALMKILVSDEAGCVFDGFGFRRRRRGAFRSPTPPRVTGCERVAPLSRSHGGCSGADFGSRRCGLFFCGRCFRRRGRGALRSPTPPRVTGCERVATLSRSLVGVGWREFGFPTVQRRFSGGRVVFSSKWERLPASAETGFGRF